MLKRMVLILLCGSCLLVHTACRATVSYAGVEARIEFLTEREEQLRALSALTGDPTYAAQADASRCEAEALRRTSPPRQGD